MIEISDYLKNEIATHAEREYPWECCGLVLGQFSKGGTKIVCEIHAISNAREEEAKRNRFLITPEEMLRGERYAANKQLEVIGVYHSHPDHPAAPSEYDREHAWPAFSYIIVSVQKGKATDLYSWILRADRSAFDEEEIGKGKSVC